MQFKLTGCRKRNQNFYNMTVSFLIWGFFFQIPDILDMIKPKLEIIGFKNMSCIAGKAERLLLLSPKSPLPKK